MNTGQGSHTNMHRASNDFEGRNNEKMPMHEDGWVFLQRAIKLALSYFWHEACKWLWMPLLKSELKVRSEFPLVLNFRCVCQGQEGEGVLGEGHNLLNTRWGSIAGRAVPQDLASWAWRLKLWKMVPHSCGGMFHIVKDDSWRSD